MRSRRRSSEPGARRKPRKSHRPGIPTRNERPAPGGRERRTVLEYREVAPRGQYLATPSTLKLRVQEERGPDRAIARLSTARTAFVGRTLRGPVNRAVLIKSFPEFQQIFGGLWQPSRLSYSVEHFFDNGGREALVGCVVHGARGAKLAPGGGGGAAH